MPLYRVTLVCLGNICRSPTADVVLNAMLAEAGLDDAYVAESCGTGDWHLGEPMDRRSALALEASGYDPSAHRARHFDTAWHDHDLILVMDSANLRDVLATLPADRHDRVRMFRSFDPEGGPDAEVPDPWYGGAQGFLDVLAMIERTCRVIVAQLESGALARRIDPAG